MWPSPGGRIAVGHGGRGHVFTFIHVEEWLHEIDIDDPKNWQEKYAEKLREAYYTK